MICPKCKTEYCEGFKTCADCMVPLVPGMPEKNKITTNPEQLSLFYRICLFLHIKLSTKDKNNLDIFFYIGFVLFFALLITLNLFYLAIRPPFILVLIIASYYIGKFVARLEARASIKNCHEIDSQKMELYE